MFSAAGRFFLLQQAGGGGGPPVPEDEYYGNGGALNMIPPIPVHNNNNNGGGNGAGRGRGNGGQHSSIIFQQQYAPAAGAPAPPPPPPPPQGAGAGAIAGEEPLPVDDNGDDYHDDLAADDIDGPPCTLADIKLNISHPLRMKIFWDDLNFGLEIKNAILSNPELDPITDFMCLQLASVSKDAEEAIERVEGLQDFKRIYDIRDTYQEGIRAVNRLVELFPNMFLALVLNPDKGNFSLIEDPSQLDFSRRFHGTGSGSRDYERIKRDFFVGIYYLMHATTPDFHSMFMGPMIMFECKDMGWSHRHELKILTKLTEELFSWYPIGGSALHYHTGAVINTMARAARKFLPEQYSEKFAVGLTFPGGLSNICLIPDPASSRRRLLRQMDENLQRRYINESNFILSRTNHLNIVPMSDNEVAVLEEARDMA